MTETRTLVETTGGTPSGELVAAIDALHDCAQASTACAMVMVETGGMVAEVRRALDCADVCEAAGRVLSRGPAPDAGVTAAVVGAAVAACDATAAACGPHADHHEHCRLHAASARACADALRGLQYPA